jgi:predicted DNA-binding transcriptional regulator YafY
MYGITAERHSIKRDIYDILILLNKEMDIDLDEHGVEERALLGYEVEYDAVQHGYKVSRRPYVFEELRLLAECVRASKFTSKSQEEHLLAAIENLCSDYQIEDLQNEVYLVGRNKTANKHIMAAMLKINQAIRENKKISFRYQKFTIKDRTQQADRRGGATYKNSPFKLIINDGYYYLLAWNSKRNTTITYRLDRMKGVDIDKEPREGGVEFNKINMKAYTQQHFGMFSGEPKTVSLRFTNNLLDTMVDRFGTASDVFYRPDDDTHFVVTTQIAISDQFFGWLCGFRKMAKIVSPPDVVSDFQNFLDDIYGKYEDD